MVRGPLRRWVVAGWTAAWIAVATAMLVPAPDTPVSDRLLHFVVFFVMTGSALTFCLSHRGLLVVTAVALVPAVGLEFAQSLVPWRHFDLLDMGANFAGVLSGYVVAAALLLAAPRRAG